MKKSIITIALAMLGVASWATDYNMVVNQNGVKTKFKVSTVTDVTFEELPAVTHNSKTVTVNDGTTVTFVDLGLPSGTLWADRNVGAATPEAYGSYFAWGETKPKSNYSWSTYIVTSVSNCGTASDPIYKELGSNADIAGTKYDAATANWGAGYKMPTKAQWKELNNSKYTTWTWTTKNGVKGYEVTSKAEGNNNSIFLPAAGNRDGWGINAVGSGGDYWSSSLYSDAPDYAWYLTFGSYGRSVSDSRRYYGLSVRPVSE